MMLLLKNFFIKIRSNNFKIIFLFIGISPSLPVALKYLGYVGVIFYTLFVYLIIATFEKYFHVAHKYFLVIFSFFQVSAIFLFLFIYPKANARALYGKGSDRDEALHIGVSRILRGLYPYSHEENTYFGNPISPLPGNLLLHLPSQVLLGNSVYTEPLLLTLSFSLLLWISKRLALYSIIACGISLEFWQDFLTGGDLASTTIFIFSLSLAYLKSSEEKKWRFALFLGLILGLSLSSRVTTLVYVIGIFFFVKKFNFYHRIVVTIYPVAIFIIITLPFYLYSPKEFSPAVVLDKSAGTTGVILEVLLLVAYLSLLRRNSSGIVSEWVSFTKFLAPIGFIVTAVPTVLMRNFNLLTYSYTTAILGLIFMLNQELSFSKDP